jgi:hypothetical protein
MTKNLPTQLRRTQYAVGVVAAIHVMALALVLLHRDVIAGAMAVQHPGGDIEALTTAAVLQAVFPHAILALVLPLRAKRLATGRPSSRIVLTVMLAIQVAAHATLPMVLAELPGYAPWVIGVQAVSLVFELAALRLLWTVESSVYFGRTKAAEPISVPVPAGR